MIYRYNSDNIRNERSKFLLKKGKVICYDWYDYPNGARWIVKYRGKYFKITHDGTGNQFFCSHAPVEITEETAKKILSNYPKAWEEAEKLWGWETLEKYFEKVMGNDDNDKE